jgi:tetratricopeptide (TPR) repeat protein
MRVFNPLLVLAVAVGALFCPGCATKTSQGGARLAPVATLEGPPLLDGSDFLNDDPADDAPASLQPTAESLAHYAAGVSYEWNDEDALAVKQFRDAALADPANERLVIKVAQRYLRNKRPADAVTVLAKSSQRPEASSLLFSWLARAELQAGKTRQALAAGRSAVQRDPTAFGGYEAELEVLFQMGKWNEAARTLNRAAKTLRPDPAALAALGGLYAAYTRAQPKDGPARTNAIALMDRVSKMSFSAPRLWQVVGDTYTQLGQSKKAAAIYMRLLAETPDASPIRAALHEKLAAIYFAEDDKTNATAQLEAIVHDNPTRSPRAWFFLGELAFDDAKLAEAASDYQNAIHWDPNFPEAYFKLAMVQVAMHRTDDAFRTLATGRARFPKAFVTEYYTAIVYLDTKNFPEAIRHFAAAEIIARAGDRSVLDYRFYFQFGEACERNQQFKQADQYLQKSIDLSPSFGEALNYLGYMLADRGDQLPRARTLIEKAVQIEPRNAAYQDSLGWVLFKLNQPQQALPYLLRAMQYSPEPDATVLDHLGEVYMALHQSSKAVEAWKKSYSLESDPEEHERVKKKLDTYSGGV